MSNPRDDRAVLQAQIESWANRLGPEWKTFHTRRNDLITQLRALSGMFSRPDPAETAALQRRYTELEGDLPALADLQTAIQAARAAITELQATPVPDGRLRTSVRDWTKSWLALLDHIAREVADRKGATPALSQVKQMETWAVDRRQAVALIDGAAKLAAQMGAEGKAQLEPLIAVWTGNLLNHANDTRWLEPALMEFVRLREEHHATLPQSVSEKSGPVKPSEKPVSEKASAGQPAQSPAGSPPSQTAAQTQQPVSSGPAAPSQQPSSGLEFYRIEQALAECGDLAEALGLPSPEIEDFVARRWQLQHQADEASAKALEAQIGVFRGSLIERSRQESEKRLERLRLRWQWFQAIYGERRPEIASSIARAEASRPDGANGLREYFDTIATAERWIYAMADGNRPKLAEYVRRAAEMCRAHVRELRQQARYLATDAELASLERNIPEDPSSQVNAKESFDRLEKCQSQLQSFQALRDQNLQGQREVLATAARLREVASEIFGVLDPAEQQSIFELAARIPAELPATQSLDETAAALARLDQLLESQRTQVRERRAAVLARLRKENQAWIGLLVEFAPEAGALKPGDAPPQDLPQLRAALEAEQRSQSRLAEMAAQAAKALNLRREQVRDSLQGYLDAPAFETHPERDTACQLLAEIDALQPLGECVTREQFLSAYTSVSEAESFLYRLESARREICSNLEDLESSFAALRDLNGLEYRPAMARRAHALLLGMKAALERQQWEPLAYQLGQTAALVEALKRDARTRISADTEEAVQRIREIARTSTDSSYVGEIERALELLETEGGLDSPSYVARQRLRRLIARGAAGAKPREVRPR